MRQTWLREDPIHAALTIGFACAFAAYTLDVLRRQWRFPSRAMRVGNGGEVLLEQIRCYVAAPVRPRVFDVATNVQLGVVRRRRDCVILDLCPVQRLEARESVERHSVTRHVVIAALRGRESARAT